MSQRVQHLLIYPNHSQFNDKTVLQLQYNLTICLGHSHLCFATTAFLSAADCLVRSILCSQGFTVGGRGDNLQVVGSGKFERKRLRKAKTNRWVILDAALASTLYMPMVRDMESWMQTWRVIQADSLRSGLTSISEIALTLFAKLYANVLSFLADMFSRGIMCVWGGQGWGGGSYVHWQI